MGQTGAAHLPVIVWPVLDDGSSVTITAYPATKGLESVYLSDSREPNNEPEGYSKIRQ